MRLDPLTVLVIAWLGTAAWMLVLWVIQRWTGNAGVVDVGWCAAFAVTVLFAAFVVYGDPGRRTLIGLMGAGWGLRLAGHVLVDRVLGKPEDGRYRRLRTQWGGQAQRNFFLLYQAEALALPVFLLPLLVLMQNPRPTFGFWELAGALLWLTAIAGEWVADVQLARFRVDPANQGGVCRAGLWRYSRHPNYFFETLHWCAYVVMGIGVPGGWLTLIGPVAMTVSLLFISGIPLAEAQALRTRGDAYREYIRSTSAFIPWFPTRPLS